MLGHLFLLIVMFLSSSGQAFEIPHTCTPSLDSERPLERDYEILKSKTDLEINGSEIYAAEVRLKGRAYWNPKIQHFVIPYGGSLAKLPQKFIEGLTAHFNQAFTNQYADALVYSDMGHAHLEMPTQQWQELKASIPDPVLRVEEVLSSPNLKALYHTVEMVQIKEGDFVKGPLPQDPWKLWRYFTRNLLGIFGDPHPVEVVWAGPNATYNTVRSIPEMTEVTTLYFSWNKSACFPFKIGSGKKYFDISFETIPYKK